jgi:glycosyltransferase involved in cell wall biosynthesis
MSAGAWPAIGRDFLPMRLTIVTPSFNQASFLRPAIDSVLRQEGDFELTLIVVDGGSTDGSVELLQSITDPRLKWTSGPDNGQADAVNKGLQLAHGDIIGWLNSDDLYTPGALAAVVQAFAADPSAGWLIGQADIIDANGNEIRTGVTRYKNHGLARYSRKRLLRENCISQPAVFWRRELGQRVGPLDVSLHHAMDYDLWLRFAATGDPIVLHQVLSHFRIHSASKTGQQTRQRFAEDCRVAARHAGADRFGLLVHRFNVEKIVWAYRLMGLLGK